MEKSIIDCMRDNGIDDETIHSFVESTHEMLLALGKFGIIYSPNESDENIPNNVYTVMIPAKYELRAEDGNVYTPKMVALEAKSIFINDRKAKGIDNPEDIVLRYKEYDSVQTEEQSAKYLSYLKEIFEEHPYFPYEVWESL